MIRAKPLPLAAAAALLLGALPAEARPYPLYGGSTRVRREIREGVREIRRERREAMREVLEADSPREFRREVREGIREIERERRELRREVRRELRRDLYW